MAPKVSVVVTCYNLGEFLDEAVTSVEAQTLRDVELLIVDDGSDAPATLEALARYAPPRARLLVTENRGLPAARNHGVHHATGELVCCLDADDRLHPTWLEKAAAELDRDPDLAFVSHWLRTFGAESSEWTPTRCDFPALLDINTVNGAAVVRRAIWERAGGQDERLRAGCEDWEFWIRLVESGHRGTILPEVLFDYRRRRGSMSDAFDDASHLALYEQLVERHRATFTAHTPQLWRRRQEDLARVHDDLDRLELEWRSGLAARRADLEQQATALEVLASAAGERQELRQRLGDTRAMLERTAGELALAQGEVAGAHQQLGRLGFALDQAQRERHRAEEQAAELRASWSWRLTLPLRYVVGMLRREPRT